MGGELIKGALINGLVNSVITGGNVGKGLALNASLLAGSKVLPLNLATTAGQSAAASAANLADDIGLAGINKTLGNASSVGFKVAPDYFTSSVPLSPTAASMGGGFRLPTDTSMLGIREGEWNWLKDYMPSGQALGKLGIDAASQSMMRQPQFITAPAGGIFQGRAPEGNAIAELISKRRKTQPSLLTDYFG